MDENKRKPQLISLTPLEKEIILEKYNGVQKFINACINEKILKKILVRVEDKKIKK